MLAYCHSPELEYYASRLPSNPGRSHLVHSLVTAYGLLQANNVRVICPVPATESDLMKYHEPGYIEALLLSGCELSEDVKELYGLEYDCPLFPELSDYVRLVAGASLAAATSLTDQNDVVDVAINWDGGRHHAKKGAAAGFCYVADAVLAIQKLRECFDRVLYVDLDVHHGDGVESAFLYSDKVFTISVHRFDSDFYPRSGGWEEQGKGRGRGFALNLPLRKGLSDTSLMKIIDGVIRPAINVLAKDGKPPAIVLQCGLDGLAHDPLRQWNLSIDGFSDGIMSIQRHASALNCKVLYLGGGGYNRTLASRCCALLTAKLAGITLPNQIPEHTLWSEYADTNNELSSASLIPYMKDENLTTLAALIDRASERISRLKVTP